MPHFFSTRKEGVNHSHQSIAWRFGSGNVHSSLKSMTPEKVAKPATPEEQEYANGIDNLRAIIEKHAPKVPHQVILYSQYGKGISIVNEELLASKGLPRDTDGRLVIPGDGLFCTAPNVLLLNKSGDAHSIILESPTAIGIVVGSWRCIEKGILPHMLELFLNAKVNPKDIKIIVGPGLGNNSYDLPEEMFQKICKENPLFKEAFHAKPSKIKAIPPTVSEKDQALMSTTSTSVAPPKPAKFILDFVKLIQIFAQGLEIQVIGQETANTFDRVEWKKVKQVAKDKNDPTILMNYYQNQLYFSARLYTHVDKNIRKLVEPSKLTLLPGIEQPKSSYDGTGRCVNGVQLSK